MKAITKLVFVLLLIAISMSLPNRASASGGANNTYICNWSQYGQCYDNLQEWMNVCAEDCTDTGDGQKQQVCWTEVTVDYIDYVYNSQGQIVQEIVTVSTDTLCTNTNQPTCIGTCVNEYNQQLNQCVVNNCTQY
jgi:hypothetical protein